MPQKLDNMGQICHLREYRQNPSNMVYGYMFMWSKRDYGGVIWSAQLHIIDLISYIVNIDLELVVI
jgi:hypothetical protein